MSYKIHSMCDRCWHKAMYPHQPGRLKEQWRKNLPCCFCGEFHHSGIYGRRSLEESKQLGCKGECAW